ncbi:MAG: class D sortase [Blastocatellia bacterium]
MLFDARAHQANQTRRFNQALHEARPADMGASGVPLGEGDPLGRIEIGRIGLSAMIEEGIDEETLRHAVGHIPGTPLAGQRGNVAFAGHRDTFFRGLRNIRRDDEITLTTLGGIYRYRVDSVKVVEPEETEVLNSGDDNVLTLVTCYPFSYAGPAPQRFIVRARQVLR